MAEQHARARLILHAGLGKTGSSAIQKYLRENADRLADRGVNYLGMQLERPIRSPLDFVAGEPIAESLATPPDAADTVRERLSALLQAKIAAAPAAHTHIWSQVSLSGAAELMRPIVAELATDVDITVVLYFRHKADWLASAYAQWGIRHKTYPGPMRSFEEFLPLADKWGADYRRVIESWRSVADSVELRSYDAVDDVVADFLGVTGIDPAYTPDRSRNQHYGTPDTAILTLFKLYQGQQEGTALPGDLALLLDSLGVANRRHRAVDPALSIPEAAAWDRFVATIESEMDGLRRDFGMDFAASQRPASQSDPIPAPAMVVPVLLEMIVALSEKVDRLERQFRARAKPIAAAPRSAKPRNGI